MSNSDEIKEGSLEETVKRLNNLARKIDNRQLNIVFNISKGPLVDEVVVGANNLRELAVRIQTIVSNTAVVLGQGKQMFQETEDIAKEKIQSIS